MRYRTRHVGYRILALSVGWNYNVLNGCATLPSSFRMTCYMTHTAIGRKLPDKTWMAIGIWNVMDNNLWIIYLSMGMTICEVGSANAHSTAGFFVLLIQNGLNTELWCYPNVNAVGFIYYSIYWCIIFSINTLCIPKKSIYVSDDVLENFYFGDAFLFVNMIFQFATQLYGKKFTFELM